MSKVLITKEMFTNMTYNTETTNNSTATGTNAEVALPTALIVFANSDINAALYHLLKSLESPFNSHAVATVLVQESIKEDFIEKLQTQLKPYTNDLLQHNNLDSFKRALETAKKLNARIVSLARPQENSLAPTLVCDFNHEQLGSDGPSGVVTLHTFRTAKEAIALVNKETLKFANVSIWHENHSYAYEIVASLKSQFYFINCMKDSSIDFKHSEKENYVFMDKSYHYENLNNEGVQKFIVFPIGSIFAN